MRKRYPHRSRQGGLALVTVLSTGLLWSCNSDKVICGEGTTLSEAGECIALVCGVGEIANEDKTLCIAAPDPCVSVVCNANFPQGVASMVPQRLNPTSCICVAQACQDNYMLSAGACVRENPECNVPGFIQEGDLCVPDETTACWQGEGYKSPLCVQELCAEHPFAEDGTDLQAIGKCVEDEPPPPESCTNGCHNGISHPHAFGGASTEACSGCHGGDPAARTRETAHVPIPTAWQTNSPQFGRPNLRYYWNYLTLAGAERFDGGLEWLRFRNPSDLRVADQTCGRDSGCHLERVENVRRSVMATAVGLVGVAQARDGIPRTVVREGDGVYQWDTTEGMTPGGTLTAINYDSSYTGSVQRLDQFEVRKRDNVVYNEIDVLREVYDKQCGDCHLGNAGANNRYADFRTSGCASCHMPYALDGRSRSRDQMIRKDEPEYPAAFAQIANFNANDLNNLDGAWLGPQRPHPIAHRISLQMSAQRCGSCHVGSNRTDWQFRGYQIDPNRTVATAFDNGFLNANQFKFTDEISDENFGRYHGQAADQVLRFVDWNNDGFDDIPADFHYTAGMECMDCHTSGEMHNELKFVKVKQVTDWADEAQVKDMSGAIWSHMDQSTEIECVSCHGNLEYRALPYEADNRNPVKNLIVCPEPGEVIPDYTVPTECDTMGNGRWLRSKFTGTFHYVAQTLDTVSNNGTGTGGSGAIRPNGAEVYSLQASIFHGRVNENPADGVGPCTNGNPNNCLKDINDNTSQITQNFSHLGARATSPVDQGQGGLECYACHATWANMCFGCHLRLADTDGNNILRDFMRSTGELSYGVVTEADFTYISPLDMQYGITSEGKIGQFLPETKQQVAHLDKDNNEYFGTKVIVNNDANIAYNLYRDRAGYGTRQYNTEQVGLGYPSAGLPAEQFAQMDQNAGQGHNQMMPHSVQRTHPVMMNCVSSGCHLDANAANADLVAARWMANPNGFANQSAYLDVLTNVGVITRNNSNQDFIVDVANGYLMGNANVDPTAFNVDQQTDYCVFEDGFPLCYNSHPAKIALGSPANPAWNGQYVRAYPTFAQMAGPMNTYLLNKMLNLVKVADENLD